MWEEFYVDVPLMFYMMKLWMGQMARVIIGLAL